MRYLIITILITLAIFYSCISVKFPETVKVEITVPSDFDIEKMRILVDTLKGLNKKDQNKINGTFEFLLHKSEIKKEKNGVQQKGMTAPKRN